METPCQWKESIRTRAATMFQFACMLQSETSIQIGFFFKFWVAKTAAQPTKVGWFPWAALEKH